jgi:hypothetical protein
LPALAFARNDPVIHALRLVQRVLLGAGKYLGHTLSHSPVNPMAAGVALEDRPSKRISMAGRPGTGFHSLQCLADLNHLPVGVDLKSA